MRRPNANASGLRKRMPPAESLLWSKLRRRSLAGFRFRRQHTVGPFVIDFACLESAVVIELDGGQNAEDEALARDARRDDFLRGQGFDVLRFWNTAVFEDLDAVLHAILVACEDGARRNS